MKLNKQKFLKTEFGAELKTCIIAWDKAIQNKDINVSNWCYAQWEVYKLALKQFYGIEYFFTSTDDYFGVVTEDKSDWLFKKERY